MADLCHICVNNKHNGVNLCGKKECDYRVCYDCRQICIITEPLPRCSCGIVTDINSAREIFINYMYIESDHLILTRFNKISGNIERCVTFLEAHILNVIRNQYTIGEVHISFDGNLHVIRKV